MAFSLGDVFAPVASIPASPKIPSVSPVTAPTPTASPPPTIVYEPGPSPDSETSLTYSDPSPPPSFPSKQASLPVDQDGSSQRGGGHANDEASTLAASSGLRSQAAPDGWHPTAPNAASAGSTSSEPIRATPDLPTARQPIAASLSSLVSAQPASTAPATGQAQSQAMAQATYSLVADAWIQDRSVVDLIKFA